MNQACIGFLGRFTYFVETDRCVDEYHRGPRPSKQFDRSVDDRYAGQDAVMFNEKMMRLARLKCHVAGDGGSNLS